MRWDTLEMAVIRSCGPRAKANRFLVHNTCWLEYFSADFQSLFLKVQNRSVCKMQELFHSFTVRFVFNFQTPSKVHVHAISAIRKHWEIKVEKNNNLVCPRKLLYAETRLQAVLLAGRKKSWIWPNCEKNVAKRFQSVIVVCPPLRAINVHPY